MYHKNINMSLDHAKNISNILIDVFQKFFEVQQYFYLSSSIENGQTKIMTIKFEDDGSINHSLSFGPQKTNEFLLDLIYRIVWNKRCFQITFFDNPDDLGFCSMLPNYDPFTYILCEIVELRSDGSKKYEMTFGFDIEKRTFLELFEILHFNAVGILREYSHTCFNSPIEEALKDSIIILN